MMEIELLETGDGSHSLQFAGTKITYHSKHGAIQESLHVFIKAGLHYMMEGRSNFKMLEMGFGTGLNALLAFLQTQMHPISIEYHTVETNPIGPELVTRLNYAERLGNPLLFNPFEEMHLAPFGETVQLSPSFTFTKYNQSITDYNMGSGYHLVFYDAFAPNAQPELWTKETFEKLRGCMAPGACLVTYCSKGDVRRAMAAAGFKVGKLPGPPGKREMVRAFNPI